MVVQIAGQLPEPPLRDISELGIALLSEDASREVKDEAASGIENASAPRALTNSREARLEIILTEYGRGLKKARKRKYRRLMRWLIVDRRRVYQSPLYTTGCVVDRHPRFLGGPSTAQSVTIMSRLPQRLQLPSHIAETPSCE
jgi:hypothetical protein